MSVHHATARKLATEAEWALLETSRARAITTLTPARLAQQIARTRTLRDKYRDLAEQQRGEARGKRKPQSTRAAEGNSNTVVKEQIFAEALERFEARLAIVTAKAAPRAKRVTRKTPTRTGTPSTKHVTKQTRSRAKPTTTVPGPDMEFGMNPPASKVKADKTSKVARSEASRGTRKAQKLTHQSAEAHQGHVGSRTRHNQAKRDGR